MEDDEQDTMESRQAGPFVRTAGGLEIVSQSAETSRDDGIWSGLVGLTLKVNKLSF